jgi:hypothetical protein
MMEEEVRMAHLSTPLRDGKKVAAVVAGISAYISQKQ